MKLSELIERLTTLHTLHGERDVYIDAVPDGLLEVGEIDQNLDGDIIIWTA